jgi:serine/threonine protein kinase
MRAHAQLRIAIGFATSAGRRAENQDFGAVDPGSTKDAELQGILAAVADGAGGAGGRVAAELAVRTFLDGTRSCNALRGIAPAAMSTLDAFNRWLHAQGQASPSLRGIASTFTAAVVRGRCATFLHVGDSRAWHLRGDALTLLTDDHVALQADGSQRLQRALGLEPALRLDSATQGIEAHDRLLLSTDGMHGALPRAEIARILSRRHSAQADAEALVSAALAAGSHDNATAIVIDIVEVPAADHGLITAWMAALPFMPLPVAGDAIDGFSLLRVLAETPAARLFVAEDGPDLVVLKFPRGQMTTPDDRHRFTREVFIAQRITHTYVGTALALADGRQSRLYLAMPFLHGETVHDRLQRRPMTVAQAVSTACKVGRGLAALHRQGVVHRDITPRNIMLLAGDSVKIIDFGIARLPGFEDPGEVETPGTLDYMAPELLEGLPGDSASDQYALGVSLYVMLTGKYPHGATPQGARPLFGPVAPPSRFCDEIPAWLDAAVLRAIALRREDRFGDVDELVFELEHASSRTAPRPARKPLIARDPVLFWKVLCVVLLIVLAASHLRI